MSILIWSTLLIALACLVFLQTHPSVLMRSLGVFLMGGSASFLYLESSRLPMEILILVMTLMLMAFASDFYSASLRTWYFRVSDSALWGTIIGGFLGGFFSWATANTLGGFIIGSFIGAFIGEVKTRGMGDFKQLLKSSTGAVTGFFGMSMKLLLGLEITFWLIKY